MDKNLELDDKVEGYVKENFWNYYVVEVDTENTLTLHFHSSGDCDVYVRKDKDPTRTNFDYYDLYTDEDFTVEIDNPAGESLHVGVFGFTECSYSVKATVEEDKCDCQHGECLEDGSCDCDKNYGGEKCNLHCTPLQPDNTHTATIGVLGLQYYCFTTVG